MKKTFGGALIALAFVFGIIATASTTADAQWSNRSYGGYNNEQLQQGYQYGVSVGSGDAQRGQSYSPQRSRYYGTPGLKLFVMGSCGVMTKRTGNTRAPTEMAAIEIVMMATTVEIAATTIRNLTPVTSRV